MKAVFFDAFGTLCEIREKRNPYRPVLKAWPTGVADAYEALMTRDCPPSDLAREAGCSEEAIKEIDDGVAAEIASMRLFSEVGTVLERLRQLDLKWAIISNLATPYAEPLLKLLPFPPNIASWSFAVGRRKPDEDIYFHACKELGVDPSSVLMTGDSMENDYITPKRLGMEARYLNRAKNQNTPECITDLTEIFSAI